MGGAGGRGDGAMLLQLVAGPAPIDRPAVVFLDIGQGDAILVFGEGGEVMLMDGGPDPVLLVRKLREFGVDRIDLLVVSHPHEDHLAGLLPVAERLSDRHDLAARLRRQRHDLRAAPTGSAADREIGMTVPALGHHRLGSLSIEVLGPVRRYASPNDQSLVLRVEGDDCSCPATSRRSPRRSSVRCPARIMKVPHSGSKYVGSRLAVGVWTGGGGDQRRAQLRSVIPLKR